MRFLFVPYNYYFVVVAAAAVFAYFLLVSAFLASHHFFHVFRSHPSILYGGFIAGTFAFFIGELNVK